MGLKSKLEICGAVWSSGHVCVGVGTMVGLMAVCVGVGTIVGLVAVCVGVGTMVGLVAVCVGVGTIVGLVAVCVDVGTTNGMDVCALSSKERNIAIAPPAVSIIPRISDISLD